MMRRLIENAVLAFVRVTLRLIRSRILPYPIGRADRLRDAGQPARAVAYYRAAAELAPDRPDLRIQSGNMLKDSGQFDAAIATYLGVIGPDRVRADAFLQLGHTYKQMGRREDAADAYRRSVSADSSLDHASWELAQWGDAEAQRQRFDDRLRAGALDPLLAISQQVTDLRARLDTLIDALPDPSAQLAFPVAFDAEFRALYSVPDPPTAPARRVVAVLLADEACAPLLYAQIEAMQAQTMAEWHLAVVVEEGHAHRIVTAAAAADSRITPWLCAGDPPAAMRAAIAAIAATAAEWVLLLGVDAVPHPRALAWLLAGAQLGPATAFVFDEQSHADTSRPAERPLVTLRQVADYDCLLVADLLGDTLAFRAEGLGDLLDRAGLAVEASPPDTIASMAVVRSLLKLEFCADGRLGHIPLRLVTAGGRARSSERAHAVAVDRHLRMRGLADVVSRATGRRGMAWRPPDPRASIAVVIPTRDNVGDVETLVRSLHGLADQPEAMSVVVVDNGSVLDASHRRLAALAATPRLRVVRREEPFNWSRLNNQAVGLTDAEIVVFANDDMVMLSRGWDTEVRGLLARPNVGIVGAKLLYPDDTVQHAGILFGWKGSTIHDGLHEAADAEGPLCRWTLPHATSAVTGAFLAIRRTTFDAVGGFDETRLAVSYSDVDIALKVRRAGGLVLWTPDIRLHHAESKSRGLDRLDPEKASRNQAERDAIERRWGAVFDSDPTVNPAWYAATLPFHLMAQPSQRRICDHIAMTASGAPWRFGLDRPD